MGSPIALGFFSEIAQPSPGALLALALVGVAFVRRLPAYERAAQITTGLTPDTAPGRVAPHVL